MNNSEIMAEQNRIAKSVDMVYLVKVFGYTPISRGNTHILREHDSFVIFNNTNTFYHYSQQQGGSPIDFCVKYGNMSIKEAIHYLLDLSGKHYEEIKTYSYERKKETKKHNLAEALPKPYENYRRVFAYLSKTRGISADVITFFMHNKMLYESADYHNCVFVARDKDGIPRYASMRGTLTGNNSFKGDVSGSDKSFGFSLYKDNTDKVVVFEAPIDLMSYMSLYPDNQDSLHALGCLDISSLNNFLDTHKDIKRVSFLTDNDKYAPEITAKHKSELIERGYIVDDHPLAELMKDVGVKDVNDYLLTSKAAAKEQNKKSIR